MKKIQFEDYEKGAELPELRVGPVKHMDLVRYSGASGDFNPIHTDPEFAKSVGLEGTIAHGMYVKALLGRLCTDAIHPSQIKSFGTKFRGQTRPGQTLILTGKVKKKQEVEGEKLLTFALQAADEAGDVKATSELVVNCS